MITRNQQAFLDMIAVSELGLGLMAVSDDGYNVIVGSTITKPILFANYADHPRKLIEIKNKVGVVINKSTAAGRYQLLARYFDAYRVQLGLKDFGHESQDLIALQQIKEQHALGDIENGHIESAIDKCANIWASLPGAGYGQHENQLSSLIAVYLNSGGILV